MAVLYTDSQMQRALGEAFYAFSELSMESVENQLVAWDAGTSEISQMLDADAQAIETVEAEIKRLQQSIAYRREHMRKGKQVLKRRAHVRSLVTKVKANVDDYILKAIEA